MSDLMIVPFKLVGTRPLIIHNGRLADPLDEYARALAAIASKRKKTEEDHAEISLREFIGGLYWASKDEGFDFTGPYIPSEYVEAALAKAASLVSKRGRDVSRGVTIEPLELEIKYDGPRDVEALFENKMFVNRARVRVGQQAVMRTRPQFRDWELQGQARVQTDILDPADVVKFLHAAGTLIGLAERRPKYGQFEVEAGEPYSERYDY